MGGKHCCHCPRQNCPDFPPPPPFPLSATVASPPRKNYLAHCLFNPSHNRATASSGVSPHASVSAIALARQYVPASFDMRWSAAKSSPHAIMSSERVG